MELGEPGLYDSALHEQYLTAYQEIITKFGFSRSVEPGRIQLLGWDLDYLCGPTLASFIDSILIRGLNDFIPDNDHPVILDCGANIGFSVLHYKRQFPKAKIIAFEPDPEFLPVLRSNLERNNAADVTVVDAAVWFRNGKAKWRCEGIDGSKIIPDNEAGEKIVLLRTVDLADYITTEIDLVKLDIEGAEYQVVVHMAEKGKLALLKNMSIECHINQSNIIPLSRMLESLAGAGFQIGINPVGQWRDLIRQPYVPPNHYEQYIAVSAWRKSNVPIKSNGKPSLPYIGIEMLQQERQQQDIQLELQAARGELQVTRSELDTRQADLEAARGELQVTRSELDTRQADLEAARGELQVTRSDLNKYTRLGKTFQKVVRLVNLILDRGRCHV